MPTVDESSIADPLQQTRNSPVSASSSRFVEDSTKRGRKKLVDNHGYTYNVKRRQGNKTDWHCIVRPKISFFLIFGFNKKKQPFLPEHQIPSAFRKLKRKAVNRFPQELAEYFDKTWITSTTWPLHPGAAISRMNKQW